MRFAVEIYYTNKENQIVESTFWLDFSDFADRETFVSLQRELLNQHPDSDGWIRLSKPE